MHVQFHIAFGTACVLLAVSAAPGAQTRSARDAADRARTKIVILKTSRSGSAGAATGFMAQQGVAVTAAHAVAQATGITAWLNGVSYPARVQAVHPSHDLAVLRLQAPELQLKPMSLAASSTALTPREELLILAGPSQGPAAKGEPTQRVLIPASLRARGAVRDPEGRLATMLTLDASVERGDSGSPVLRVSDGAVVGVLSSRELPEEDGISRTAYAVPVETVSPWLDGLKNPEPNEEFYLFRLTR